MCHGKHNTQFVEYSITDRFGHLLFLKYKTNNSLVYIKSLDCGHTKIKLLKYYCCVAQRSIVVRMSSCPETVTQK